MTQPTPDPEPTPTPPPTPEHHAPPESPAPEGHASEGLDGLAKRVDDLEAVVSALVQKPDSTPGGKPWTHRNVF